MILRLMALLRVVRLLKVFDIERKAFLKMCWFGEAWNGLNECGMSLGCSLLACSLLLAFRSLGLETFLESLKI